MSDKKSKARPDRDHLPQLVAIARAKRKIKTKLCRCDKRANSKPS